MNVTSSRNITINCSVEYPSPKYGGSKIRVFWKALNKGLLNIDSKDKNKFIYHPNSSLVIESFQNRTKLIGNIEQNDCSLFISNVCQKDAGMYYLRVETGSENYSFYKPHLVLQCKYNLWNLKANFNNNINSIRILHSWHLGL